MRIEWLSLKDYVESVKLQDRTLDRAALIRSMLPTDAPSFEVIYGLEHPLTITLGKRSNPLNDIKVSIRDLRAKKVAVVGTDRGGHATLHNPGQLVIYPIINLRERRMRVRDYMRLIQDVTRRFLTDFGVSLLPPQQDPGIYTPDGKIAFFGIRIKNGITSHGLAININNCLTDFQFIRSCDRDIETFARLADVTHPPAMDVLFAQWCNYFCTGLGLTQDLNRPMVERHFELRV
jgi:lipoyl(octanoyl) transferase